MSTLSEFLLTRFAEDEAWIRSDGDYLEDCQECGFGQQPRSPYSRARLLSECEVKRQVVREASSARYPDDDEWSAGQAAGEVDAYGTACRLLALPYSDHPDWREEWRP